MLEAEGSRALNNEAERAKREAYLTAMGEALGANPFTVRITTDALLKAAASFATVDISKGRYLTSEEDRGRIETVGIMFLNGSPHKAALKFTVGSTVLALLRDDTDSETFTGLGSRIGQWTSETDDAEARFNQLLEMK